MAEPDPIHGPSGTSVIEYSVAVPIHARRATQPGTHPSRLTWISLLTKCADDIAMKDEWTYVHNSVNVGNRCPDDVEKGGRDQFEQIPLEGGETTALGPEEPKPAQ